MLRRSTDPRAGAILILVAGITGLLTSLAIMFIVRMRADAEEVGVSMRDAQARIMLLAACNYALEGARVGYDLPATPEHEEAFGWIDVRDGSVGPKTQAGVPCWNPALVEDGDGDGTPDRPAWPAKGGVARSPMQVLQRPPYAVSMTARYNPISTATASADFGMPYLRYPDPRPAVDNGWSDWNDLAGRTSVSAANWNDYARGDIRPRSNSVNLSWFRLYRDGDATFIVTCGAGATAGFRDWNEVVGAGEEMRFYNDQKAFEDALAAETRLWYRIEWSPAVMSLDYQLIDHELARDHNDHYAVWPMNASDARAHNIRSPTHAKNFLGTIRWVRRLPVPPLDGKW